jgi:hypothetical protein
MSDDPKIIESPLSGPFTRDNITVEVLIYRLETDAEWLLEVVDTQDTSTVWDKTFASDQAAYDFFLDSVEAEGLAQILSDEIDTLH